ncbi:MAG: RNA polymerase subunit sigma [Pseudobutyrivibrio sp.]|nr:RNA polymerase subunit sigma [Pseudobutyrivibrio sp.]
MEKNFGDTSKEVIKAKENPDFRNEFITAHRKFILSKAYGVVGHFVNENDDEYSIALIAFNEAIDSYEESKGDFFALASVVITRRLLDYIKGESKHKNEILTDSLGSDIDSSDEDINIAFNMELKTKEAELSTSNNSFSPSTSSMQDEIYSLGDVLKKYGFSFFDLVDCSPKSTKTKKACSEVINYVLKDETTLKKMRKSLLLPIKEITENTKVPRKILERHRKYIIAAIEILDGDYPQIAEYMTYIRKG